MKDFQSTGILSRMLKNLGSSIPTKSKVERNLNVKYVFSKYHFVVLIRSLYYFLDEFEISNIYVNDYY